MSQPSSLQWVVTYYLYAPDSPYLEIDGASIQRGIMRRTNAKSIRRYIVGTLEAASVQALDRKWGVSRDMAELKGLTQSGNSRDSPV
jgi:hypothetical protein